jgi:hypothetical protein
MPSQTDTASLLDDERVTLMGVPGSPYTRKMLALLRYRQIPYRLLLGSNVQGGEIAGLPQPKVSLLPTFFLRGANGSLEAVTDSTPLIRHFEIAYPDRRAVPDDPALALIDALIEDFADEWLTKAMFHYRWAYGADIAKAGAVLPRLRGCAMSGPTKRPGRSSRPAMNASSMPLRITCAATAFCWAPGPARRTLACSASSPNLRILTPPAWPSRCSARRVSMAGSARSRTCRVCSRWPVTGSTWQACRPR